MKKTMKLIGTIVVLAMMLGVMPAAVYADGSYYVDTNYIVLSPGETATITLSADNAAGRVDWNSEGTVTAAGSEWLDNDSRTFTVTADSVGTGYINVIPTDIATGDDEVLDYGYTIQVEVVSDEPTPVQEPAPNDPENTNAETIQEEPVQQEEEAQQQAEEPAEQAEQAEPLAAGDVLTDGSNYAGLSEEERLYTSVGDSELYIIRYPRWVDEEGNVVWNDEVYNLDTLPGFELATVNYKEMNVDTFRYKDQITAFVLKNLETDRSNYYVLKDDGTGFEELSYVTANGKTYIVVDFPKDFVVPDGYQMVEMTLGSGKVQALKKAAEPVQEMPAEPAEMPAEPVEEANGALIPASQKSVSIVADQRTKVMLKGYETKVSPGLDSADPSGDLYYIYCLVDGQTQLYSYDSKEGTLQRASIVVYEEIPTEPETVIIYETAPAEESQVQTPAQETAPAQSQQEPEGIGSFLKGIGWNSMQIQVKVLLIALAVAILLIIILIILFAAMSSRNRKRNRKNRKNAIPPRSAGRTAPLNEDDDAFFSYVKTDDDYDRTR